MGQEIFQVGQPVQAAVRDGSCMSCSWLWARVPMVHQVTPVLSVFRVRHTPTGAQ
jgi:hypothetical protein